MSEVPAIPAVSSAASLAAVPSLPSSAAAGGDGAKGEKRRRGRGDPMKNPEKSQDIPVKDARVQTGLAATGSIAPVVVDERSALPSQSQSNAKPGRPEGRDRDKSKPAPRKEAAPSHGSTCIVCVEPIRHFALGSCGHRSLCSTCYAINAKQYDRRSCVTCKFPFEEVVITADHIRPFEGFDASQLMAVPQYPRTYFDDRREINRLDHLFAIACPQCGQKFRRIQELKEHVKETYGKQFCAICLDKRKGVFLRNQRLYSPEELVQHMAKGDPATRDEGLIPVHIRCKLCSYTSYDEEDRNKHMLDRHVCCQLCRRRGAEEWLANDDGLLKHYRTAHVTCDDPKCRASPMENVFDNDIALRVHMMNVHGSSASKQAIRDMQRLTLDFRSRPSAPSEAVATSAVSAAAVPPAPEHDQYEQLRLSGDSKEQNRVLISEIRRLRGEAGFTQFRNLSAEFFRREISPETYYNHFCSLFGGYSSAAPLWMLLVSSLPDPTLRTQLHQVHYDNKKSGGGFAAVSKTIASKASKESASKAKRKEHATTASISEEESAPPVETAPVALTAVVAETAVSSSSTTEESKEESTQACATSEVASSIRGKQKKKQLLYSVGLNVKPKAY
jgi:hypothetical protein